MTGGSGITRTIAVTQAAASATAPSLTVTPASLDFSAAGASISIVVSSDIAWTAADSAPWLSVSPTAGTGNGILTVIIRENAEAAVRSDTIVVTGGNTTCKIPVTQTAPTLTVPTDTLKYTAAGGSLNRPVTSNTDWSASPSATWLTVTPSGTGNGTLTVTVEANTGAARTATVSVTDGGTKTFTIRVEQAASGTPSAILTLSRDRLSFTAADSTQRIAVTSDTNWAVVNSATWITVSPELGTGNGSFNIQVAANTTGAVREANVSVLGGGLKQTVRVMQSIVATLAVDTLSREYGSGGGVQSLRIISDTSWTAVSSATWLSVSPPSGKNNGTLILTAAANTDAARTATVTVTADGVQRTVSVLQKSGQPLVVVDPIPPVAPGSRAEIDILLDVPLYEPFRVQFTLTLPAEFTLDESATKLASDLVDRYTLEITPIATATWKFLIQPTVSTLAGSQTGYRELVHVIYTVAESAPIGNYTLKLKQIELTGLNSGLTHQQEEVSVPVTVSNPTGLTPVEPSTVWYVNGILTVHTPSAERIDIYSVAGQLLFKARKDAGEAAFDLNGLPRGVLIVHGSSGWVKKIAR
ncbi:MAG: BACON domain-containing protein [Tannerella sp.]|nr:BACON domain-containing protein [Tannerella sp.]